MKRLSYRRSWELVLAILSFTQMTTGWATGMAAGTSTPRQLPYQNPRAGHPIPSQPLASKHFSGRGAFGSGAQYHTQRLTASAALAPPTPGMYLIDVAGFGVGPGTFQITYQSPENAHFAFCASTSSGSGLIGNGPLALHWPVSWYLGGTNIASSLIVFNGGLTEVVLTYSTQPGSATPIEAYRAIFVTATESGTGGTAKTYTYDAQPGYPRYIIPMVSVATGTATGVPSATISFPTLGSYADIVECQGTQEILYLETCSAGYQPANSISLTHTAKTLGGATTVNVAGVLYY